MRLVQSLIAGGLASDIFIIEVSRKPIPQKQSQALYCRNPTLTNICIEFLVRKRNMKFFAANHDVATAVCKLKMQMFHLFECAVASLWLGWFGAVLWLRVALLLSQKQVRRRISDKLHHPLIEFKLMAKFCGYL